MYYIKFFNLTYLELFLTNVLVLFKTSRLIFGNFVSVWLLYKLSMVNFLFRKVHLSKLVWNWFSEPTIKSACRHVWQIICLLQLTSKRTICLLSCILLASPTLIVIFHLSRPARRTPLFKMLLSSRQPTSFRWRRL